jgi:hypothetical protein|tara:strand:- start:3142 stop:3327 length:186 start_codon:yes stop_codon:yes gene_type:complete
MKIRRKTCLEKRYTDKMGRLHNNITYIKKTLLNIIPLKIILKHRKTYYGEIKDCEDCVLAK